MDPKEVLRLESFMRTRFQMPVIELKRRPQKDDSVEVYIGDEFIGLIFRDDEDEDLSYSFQMAILDFDLPPG